MGPAVPGSRDSGERVEPGSAGAGAPLAEADVKKTALRRRPVGMQRDIDTLFSVKADGSRNAIHPADMHGRFQRLKHGLWYLLIAVYLLVPWLEIGGRPVLLIDIPHRHFYLLGRTFNAQDFWLAFFFVTGLGFALFVVAALFGRIWCGYACPQTVFLEGVFRRIERLIEGPAAKRAKLDGARLGEKLVRRGAKLVVFFLIAGVIAHSFVGYFMPVSLLVEAVTSSPAQHPWAFAFVVVATLALFVNFTWFREQMCIVVCPYGRLQGALYDPDTVVVGYDQRRGEPRGPAGTAGAGDCVDCYRCVAVCPTGIDIRNGTQLECVGCANCIDACDEVMVRMDRAKGLVRYDSQRGFETGRRRFVRGRVALYGALLALGAGLFTWAVAHRRPFEAVLERIPGGAYALEGDRVRNSFNLHLINKLPGRRRFTTVVVGPDRAETIIATSEVDLESLEDRRIPVHVNVPRTEFRAGLRSEILVQCADPDDGLLTRTATAPLLGPSRGHR